MRDDVILRASHDGHTKQEIRESFTSDVPLCGKVGLVEVDLNNRIETARQPTAGCKRKIMTEQNKATLTKTKAGRRFMGLMVAFNSGDSARIRAFVEQYITDDALEKNDIAQWHDELTRIYAATGRLKVMQVIGAEEYRVVVLMQSTSTGLLYITEMSISEDYPHKISEFSHHPAS